MEKGVRRGADLRAQTRIASPIQGTISPAEVRCPLMPPTPRGHPRTNWLRLGAIALLLGAVTTVAVAWAGAVFEKAYRAPHNTETLVFESFSTRYYVQSGWIVTRNIINWEDGQRKYASLYPAWIDAETNASRSHAPFWSQAWLRTRPQCPPGTWASPGHQSALNEFAAGWPMRALCCDCDEPSQDPTTKLAVYPPSRGGFTLPCHVIKDGATVFLPRALPYRPLLLGFATDTTIFAALWMLVLLRPAAIRAHRRRKNRCPSCGYDRRGLPSAQTPCPECGTS